MNIRQGQGRLLDLLKKIKKVETNPDQFLPLAMKIYAELYKKKYSTYCKQEDFLRKIQKINAITINIVINSLTDLIYQKVKTFTPESLANLETYGLLNKTNDIQTLQELLNATIPLYVQDTILAIKAHSHRSMILENFIFMAEECLSRNNFMLAKAIYGGLIQANVSRLIQEGEIIKGLSPNAKLSLETLKELFNDIMENGLKEKVKSTDGPMLYSVGIFFAASRKLSGDIDCKKMQIREKEKQQASIHKISESVNTNVYIEKSFLQNTINELERDIDFILSEHARECEKEYKYQFVKRDYSSRIDEQSISINLQQQILEHATIRSYVAAKNQQGLAKDTQRKTEEDMQLAEDTSTIDVLKTNRVYAEEKIKETLLIIEEFDHRTEAVSYECRPKNKKLAPSIIIKCFPEISLPDKIVLYRKYRSAIAKKVAMKLVLPNTPQAYLDDIKIKLIRLAKYGANKNNDKTEKKKNNAIKILDYLYKAESLDLKIKYLYHSILMTHTPKNGRKSWIIKFKFVSLINELIISLEAVKNENKINNGNNYEKKLLDFILDLEKNQSDILSRACIHSLHMIYNDLGKIKPGPEKLTYFQKTLFFATEENNALNLFDKMRGNKVISKLLTELYSNAQLESNIEIPNESLISSKATEDTLPSDDVGNNPTQSNSSPDLETIELLPLRRSRNGEENKICNEGINPFEFWRNLEEKNLQSKESKTEILREPAPLKIGH